MDKRSGAHIYSESAGAPVRAVVAGPVGAAVPATDAANAPDAGPAGAAIPAPAATDASEADVARGAAGPAASAKGWGTLPRISTTFRTQGLRQTGVDALLLPYNGQHPPRDEVRPLHRLSRNADCNIGCGCYCILFRGSFASLHNQRLLQVKEIICTLAKRAANALRRDCRKYKLEVLAREHNQQNTKSIATLLALLWLLIKVRQVKAQAELFLVENQGHAQRYVMVMGAMILSVHHGIGPELGRAWCVSMTEQGIAVNTWLDTVFPGGGGPPRPAADGTMPPMAYFDTLM